MFFTMFMKKRKDGKWWLECHTGSEKPYVSAGIAFNRAICVDEVNSEKINEFIDEINQEALLYEMTYTPYRMK